ncbi:hypothetical protein [Saccharothrix hoggarensis]|uniref:Uncharacterized protein n=1 Tax=Saccharothrix hoggarensis TaxID=913853 RepID=A0ABW3QDR0_9PSEU
MIITDIPGLPTTITSWGIDWPECACRNDPQGEGFWPVNPQGERVEPDKEAWPKQLYVCDRQTCGLVLDAATFDAEAQTFGIVGIILPPKVVALTREAARCVCGNTDQHWDFWPVDQHGRQQSDPGEDIGDRMRCARPGCGLVYDWITYDREAGTFDVIGRIKDVETARADV